MYPRSYVVFDTETTGLKSSESKVIEIGAIKFDNNKEIETFSMLIDPKETISSFITSLTGISNDDLKGQKNITEVLPQFLDFIAGYPLVAHNIGFDIAMINEECVRCGYPKLSNERFDTVTLAKRHLHHFGFRNYKLETIKEFLGLEYGSHRALDDCYVCATVYQLCLKHSGDRLFQVI